MAVVAVATHVPPEAAHLAKVGDRVSDTIGRGIRFKMVQVDDEPRKRPEVDNARRLPEAHRAAPDIAPDTAFGEIPNVWAGHVVTDTDPIVERERYLTEPPRVIVTADGTISTTLEVDGYRIAVLMTPPEGTGGPDRHNVAARRRLTDAVGAVWGRHVRGDH